MRKEAENRTIDMMSAKIPTVNASTIAFFKFSFAPTSE